MRTYVDLFFSSESDAALDVVSKVRELAGVDFVSGPHDLLFSWQTVDEFRTMLEKVHRALAGSGIVYRIETVLDDAGYVDPVPWPPPTRPGEPIPHPGYGRPERRRP